MMKYKIYAIITGLFALLLGCNSNSKIKQDFPSINVEQLAGKMTTNPDLVFVDVRTEGEFNGELGHLDNAILIPVQEIEQRYSELENYREKEIIVYCRSGNRSRFATAFLREQGFDATNLAGGMIAWNKLQNK